MSFRVFLSFSCFLLLSVLSIQSVAQCPADEVEIEISIVPDQYSETENNWQILDLNGQVLDGGDYLGGTVCVAADACVIVRIVDTYGDGIFDPGGVTISYDGEVVADFPDFSSIYEIAMGCGEGFSCNSPQEIDMGMHEVPASGHWYSFTPAENGQYTLSTCDSELHCAEAIAVHNICDGLAANTNEEGFTFYADSGCDGEGAYLSIPLEGGVQYWVRIRSEEDCAGLEFELAYEGPIVGCTDPGACNYNPFAEIDDPASCVYEGPECNGPDLKIMVSDIESSMFLTTYNNTDNCLINEGCLLGYGQREIVRFTTRIENIGEQDYYIGYAPTDVSAPSTQFNYDNCHNHWHYKGYAEYLVFDSQQNLLPVGFKAGFCVMDLNCSYGGGTAQYGCSEMGISAHCGDIYDAGLDCQWIDVTDLEAGFYTLVVRINWDQDPDFLGRVETDFVNNWAQVCFELVRDQNGTAVDIIQSSDCAPFEDCAGIPYGDTAIDCAGECGGSAIFGDMNADGTLGTLDVLTYYQGIMDGSVEVSTCNDLDGDGSLTIADASLLAGCSLFSAGNHQHPDGSIGAHGHCEFPVNIANPFQKVSMQLGEVNEVENYFDVMIMNPDNRVLSYEYMTSGVEVSQAQNLYFEGGFNPNMASSTSGKVMALPLEEQNIDKNLEMVALTRVYYEPLAAGESADICLDEIIKVMNTNYESVETEVLGDCITITSSVGNQDITDSFTNFTVSPNPMAVSAIVKFENTERDLVEVRLTNTSGQVVQQFSSQAGSFELQRSDLLSGMYFLTISTDTRSSTKKIILP